MNFLIYEGLCREFHGWSLHDVRSLTYREKMYWQTRIVSKG